MPTIELAALLDLDRRAVQASVAAAGDLSDADLDKPTPCGDWTLADLVAHMTVQQRGFAAAARGRGADPDLWASRRQAADGPGTSTAYAAISADLLGAFADPQLGDTGFLLPEIRDGGPFPAHVAVGFHLVDNVVHAGTSPSAASDTSSSTLMSSRRRWRSPSRSRTAPSVTNHTPRSPTAAQPPATPHRSNGSCCC